MQRKPTRPQETSDEAIQATEQHVQADIARVGHLAGYASGEGRLGVMLVA